jgi:predicted dehydrogenase
MRALILGLGSIGRRHARTIRTLDPEAEIFALRSGDGDSEPGVRDIRRIEDCPKPLDLAIVATPTHLHRSSVEQVSALRPFLFLEKPLALTVDDASAIVQALESAKMQSYIGCHLRFHPCLQWVRAALQSSPRDIRGIQAACLSWLPDWQPQNDYRKSFRSDPAQSGGVHLELIHELDYVTWIFGMPQSSALQLHAAPELQIDAPAIAHYDLRYPSFTATIDLSYASHGKKRTLEITFADDRWIVDLLSFTVRDADDRILFASQHSMDDVYAEQMRHVLQCAAKKEHSSHEAKDALETLRFALS